MSDRINPSGDEMLDRTIRVALTREADRLAATQPRADIAFSHLAKRVAGNQSNGTASRFGLPLGRHAGAAAWLVLLLIAALAVVVGALVLRDQRPPIATGPFGPGTPCEISLDEGLILEYRSGFTVTTIDEAGVVLRAVDNIFANPQSPLSTGLEIDLSIRQLSAAGLVTVKNRMDSLGIDSCHALRADAGGSLVARSPHGLGQLSFSNSQGLRSLAPMATEETTRFLQELHGDLDHLDRWLGPDALAAKETLAPDRWVVMIVVSNGGSALKLANEFTIGLGPFAAARGVTHLYLPDGIAPEHFGDPLGAADARPDLTRRCGTISTPEAGALVDSLEGQTFVGGAGMYIWIEPAIGSWQDCDQLADVMGYGGSSAPTGPAATPAVEGDLSPIDPCGLVPADLRGPIERSYPVGPPPFGVAARSCLLLETQAMGNIRERHVVWLYPWAVSELEAGTLAGSMFGAGFEAGTLDGAPTWRNHCLTSSVDCTGGFAAWHDGRFVLVEVLRLGATPARVAPAERIMAAVLERLRQAAP